MKAEYKRDLQNNYLILEAPGEAEEDEYKIRMAERNEIPGLLPFQSSRKDGTLFFRYEITSKQPLDSIYEKRVMDARDIMLLLSGIRDTIDALQKYLLNPAQLIFEPQYIYVGANRNKIFLCYFPGAENSFPLTDLAEFVLKRLDHEDRMAVNLGYGFYQRALEENFSLQQTIKELLTAAKEGEWESEAAWNKAMEASAGSGFAEADGRSFAEPGGSGRVFAGTDEDRKGRGFTGADGGRKGREFAEPGGSRRRLAGADGGRKGREFAETGGGRRGKEFAEIGGNRRSERGDGAWAGKTAADFSMYAEDEYEVIHKERKNKKQERRKQEKRSRRNKSRERKRGGSKEESREKTGIFQKIHPAVLLSCLFLLAALEIIFYLEIISLTEAGGLFFLILSVEMLIHKRWKDAGERENRKANDWIEEEEDDEIYRELREEMYARETSGSADPGGMRDFGPGLGKNGYRAYTHRDFEESGGFGTGEGENLAEKEMIGETCCLVQDTEREGLRLICAQTGNGSHTFQDIFVDQKRLYVGKMKGESDIILDSPTVSRVHARLEGRDGKYYVKDLNSKNGTFCNGERLNPQEEREVKSGDRIAFAEIEYQAM